MFYCERCNSGFNETVAATTSHCPRCFAKDGISAPLRFRLSGAEAMRVAGKTPRRGEERRETEPAQRA